MSMATQKPLVDPESLLKSFSRHEELRKLLDIVTPAGDDLVIVARREGEDDFGRIVWANPAFLYFCLTRWENFRDADYAERTKTLKLNNTPANRLFGQRTEQSAFRKIQSCISDREIIKIDNMTMHQLVINDSWMASENVTIKCDLTVDPVTFDENGMIVYRATPKNAYRPVVGEIVYCNFSSTFSPPEMTARHMAVVLHYDRNQKYGVILPISSAQRDDRQQWRFVEIPQTDRYVNFNNKKDDAGNVIPSYVICDQIHTVAARRLSPTASRMLLETPELEMVRRHVACCLSFMNHSTFMGDNGDNSTIAEVTQNLGLKFIPYCQTE